MSTDLDTLLDQLLDREAGYVDHPDDTGGPTKFGITQREARANAYSGDMRDLPREVARDIYRRKYWFGSGFYLVASLSGTVAAELLDTGVNMGPKVASEFLQRALNALNREQKDYPDVRADGAIGEFTLDAMRCFLAARGAEGESVLMKALECLQGERYIHLAEVRQANESFVYGWLRNRIGNEL